MKMISNVPSESPLKEKMDITTRTVDVKVRFEGIVNIEDLLRREYIPDSSMLLASAVVNQLIVLIAGHPALHSFLLRLDHHRLR